MLLPLLAAGCATALDPGVVASAHVRATAEQHGALHRWQPGTTLVVDVSVLGDRDAALVFAAFDAWLAESQIPVTVRPVEPGGEPNVVVGTPERVDAPSPALGLARLEWRGPWIERAWLEIGGRDRQGLAVAPLDRWTALVHEVGHVLGLGHSPRPSSVMHAAASGSSVDAADRAALTLLYASLPSATGPSLASTRDTP